MDRSVGKARTLLLFGVIATGITGIADYLILRGIFLQWRAEDFPGTEGEVTRSGVRIDRDSDGTTYRAEVEFDYEVDGRAFHGTRYRYLDGGSSDRNWHEAVVRRYPAGRRVRVYYDPGAPEDAVLEPGVSGGDAFLVAFITPFNLAAIWIGLALGGALLRRLRPLPAGGVPILRRGTRTVVRLPRIPPWEAAGMCAGIISFGSIFVFLVFADARPTMGQVQAVWVLILIAAPGVYLWRRHVVGTGAKDLIIDPSGRTLSLPRTWGRRGDVTLCFDEIERIRVETITRRGRGSRSTPTYAPILVWRDGTSTTEEKLAEWYDEERAEAFVDWLKERIGRKD